MSPHPERDLQRLLAEEPFVRMLAHQLVAGDADEVVQQTWLRAVQHGGGGVQRPRHWLARIVRHVAANLRRSDRRRRGRDRAAAVHELAPSSATLVEREESRRALVAAVDALPAALRTVVLLRWFEGQPPRRIAAALGVPAATVSVQLQRALELLRQRLDASHGGDRRAWQLPLLPFLVRPLPPPLQSWPALPVPTGAIVMLSKAKFAAAAAVLLLVAGGLVLWPEASANAPAAATPVAVSEPARSTAEPTAPDAASPLAVAERAAVPTELAPASATGTLLARLRGRGEGPPVADVVMTLTPFAGDPWSEGRRRHTDGEGQARYDELAPGRYALSCCLADAKQVEIVAGRTAELELELAPLQKVSGIVVDADELPVAGAWIECMDVGSDHPPERLAVSGTDGRFAMWAPLRAVIGARATGHIASRSQSVLGKDGSATEVRLVVGSLAGAIDGLIVDSGNAPVAGAVVIVGDNPRHGIPQCNAVAFSDAAGRFRIDGILAAGRPSVLVRARGFAPWRGRCDPLPGQTTPLRVTLVAGSTIVGTVSDAAGRPVSGADVQIGVRGTWDCLRTTTGEAGRFELRNLPAGGLQLQAHHLQKGDCQQLVHVAAGATATCALQLSPRVELRGRVVDADRIGVAGAQVMLADRHRMTSAVTDADGRFRIANCPQGTSNTLRVTGRDIETLLRQGVDPQGGEVELQVERTAKKSVRIRGTVVDAEGRPVQALVEAEREDGAARADAAPTDNQGRFELGPVVPGSWRLTVHSNEHPWFPSECRELAADAVWDLETITLGRGGTANVQQRGPKAGAARFGVEDANGRTVGGVMPSGLTNVLAAGEYSLRVFGPGVALQVVPFAVRVGEQADVVVDVTAGVSQAFAIELPPRMRGQWTLSLTRGDTRIGSTSEAIRTDQPLATELWLAPGDYTATAMAGKLRGSASFTVGAAPGPAVRIAMR